MNLTVWSLLLATNLHICLSQSGVGDAGEDRGLHKHKRRRYQQYSSAPCYNGLYRDNSNSDSRSLLALGGAALGGAAVGYHLGTKFQKQPIINNNIYNSYPAGGGAPCFPGNDYGGGGYGGGLVGGLLGSHPILASHLGLGGLNGFGIPRNGNWDRTVRQLDRNVVRPITRWLK